MSKQTFGGVAILVIIAVVFIVPAAYPKIDVNYYTKYNTYEKEWRYNNFNLTLTRSSSYYTSVCFRIKNTAEPLLQYVIPASNFKVTINTNTECENCDIYTSLETLYAQEIKDVCRNMRTSLNVTNPTIALIAQWQALSLNQNTRLNYECQQIKDENDKVTYFCELK